MFGILCFFMFVKSSRKKKEEVSNCPNALIYVTTDVYPPRPTYGKLFYYLFLSMIICENLFFLGGLFWISYCLWSSVRISSFYDNFFESLLIYDHLSESFSFIKIFLNLFLFFYLCVLILIFFYQIYSHLYAFILISKN